MKQKKSTIMDIAKETGLSIATVSRVVSDNGYPVSAASKKKILDAIDKYNYQPNIYGRMLKNNKSMDIGVIIPTLQNPIYTQYLSGIESIADKFGYSVILCNSSRNAEKEIKYIRSLQQKQVCGIIMASINVDCQNLIKETLQDTKCVFIDQEIADVNANQVRFNYDEAGKLATDYLIEKGHKNIAFLTAPLNRKSRQSLFSGYLKSLSENNISFNNDYLIVSENEKELNKSEYEFQNVRSHALKYLGLKDRPTAIFTANDMTALGVIQKLSEVGVNVPQDVSVIGFDNITISQMATPSLTTVDKNAYEIGRNACRFLNGILNGESAQMEEISPKLIARNSVKNIKGGV